MYVYVSNGAFSKETEQNIIFKSVGITGLNTKTIQIHQYFNIEQMRGYILTEATAHI
jgi:hypothetical protein